MKAIKKDNKLLIILGLCLLCYLVLVALQGLIFSNRFGYSTEVGGVSVSLKTKEEATRILAGRKALYLDEQVTLGEKEYPARDIVADFEVEKAIDNALQLQKDNFYQFSALFGSKGSVNPVLSDNYQKILLAEYNKRAIKPVDATLDADQSEVIPEKFGRRVMLAESREKVSQDLSLVVTKSGFVIDNLAPMVSTEDVEALLASAQEVVNEPIELTSTRGDFEVNQSELKGWLKIMPKSPKTLVAKEIFLPVNEEFGYFDRTKILGYLDKIAKNIDAQKENARLTVENGIIRVAVPEKNGYQLDKEDALEKIEKAVVGERVVELKIITTLADVRRDNLSELGINELVSSGWSNFSGSPKNRIHNIRTGANKFDGVLIAPNEKFSFNTILGPVEASTGYLPELVILENKTTPQYGGGLCQVSSTAFRAALNAGFPILERKMHAYPVKYYKPYGVDATIYLPKPDLVFRNDSEHYILVQTSISGTKLYFDFYGTKTGQNVKFAGNSQGTGAVTEVEQVSPAIYDQGVRGPGSFTARFYRFIFDATNKLIRTDTYTSRYDSPDKYPH